MTFVCAFDKEELFLKKMDSCNTDQYTLLEEPLNAPYNFSRG